MKSLYKQRGFWNAVLPAVASIFGANSAAKGQQQANQINIALARENNAFNASQAQANRDFQERMSNTQYQRGIEDMKAAGLNPMLGYSQGGASSPSGSTASGTAARVESTQSQVAANATAAATMLAQLDLVKAQTAATNAQAAKTTAEAQNVGSQGDNVRADTDLKRATIGKSEADQRNIIQTTDQIREIMRKYPLEREQLEGLIRKNISDTNLVKAMIETEGSRPYAVTAAAESDKERAGLYRLDQQHSAYGLAQSRASEKFYSPGAIGEQSQAVRMLMDVIRGLASSSRSLQR